MDKLSIIHRRVLIRSWRAADEIANKKNLNFFQFTNHAGHWLVNAKGKIKRCFRNRMECVSLRKLYRLSTDCRKNQGWKGDERLDTSNPDNWRRWSEEEKKKAMEKELECGGGSTFCTVPAALVAALAHLHKKKHWYELNVSPPAHASPSSSTGFRTPPQIEEEQTVHVELVGKKEISARC